MLFIENLNVFRVNLFSIYCLLQEKIAIAIFNEKHKSHLMDHDSDYYKFMMLRYELRTLFFYD